MTTAKPVALCCMSHSPLLNLPGPSPELLDDIDSAVTAAAAFVRAFDPELVVIFAPDHYNGFFYRLMPPFCIGTAAVGVGDYGTYAGALNVPADIATQCAEELWDAGVDIAVSASVDVDHGTVQPLQALFGDITSVPVLPVFVNCVATPLGPLKRTRALGTAVGHFVATLGKRVLIVGSGGLSHDPPVPTLATAPPAALGRIVHGEPMSAEQRSARQAAVMTAAHDFASGVGALRPRCSNSSTPTAVPRSTTGRTRGSPPRRATRPTRSARGWLPSRRWPPRDRTRPRSATTGPRQS
jgi:2,3-dihydroxyphenylpropionate 1,2-dioxygenase